MGVSRSRRELLGNFAAIPNGRYVEHIPQLRAITTTEMAVEAGQAVAPETAGLGIAWDRDAMDDRRVA